MKEDLEPKDIDLIIQSFPVGLLVFNENRKIAFSNAAAAKLFHKTKKEMIDKSCGDFILCKNREKHVLGCGHGEKCPDCLIDQTLKKAISEPQTGYTAEGETVISSEAFNEPKYFSYKLSIMTIRNRRHVMIALEDITDRKTVEVRLKKTQKLAKIGSWELDVASGRLEWSDEVYRIFGLRPQEFPATYEAFLEAIHPEDRSSVDKAYTDSVKNNLDRYEIEHRVIRKDTGEVRIVFEKCEHEKGDDGQILRSIGMVQDISDLRQQEEQLRLLTRAIEQSAESVMITDAEGIIQYINPVFTKITGYTFDEVVGKNPRFLNSGKMGRRFYENLWNTISKGKVWKGEFYNKTKAGTFYWEEATISPVYNSSGDLIHFVAAKSDITDRKKLEQHKEDIDRIMRHDLKTPLNAVIALPQVLKEDENLTPDQIDSLNLIEDSGRNMLRMIDSSLDMFKMEAGKFIYNPVQIDALQTVSHLIRQNQYQLSEKGISCIITINEKPVARGDNFFISAEERLLQTLLGNLFVNAIQASPEQKTIEFKFFESEKTREKMLIMQNTGTVPEAIRDNFFDKYTTFGKKQGTGLGTYSAKLIAESMGYTISMETSEAENETRLTVEFQ